MPITIETYGELETTVLGYFQAQLPDQGFALDDYLGKWSRVLALTLWSLKKSIEDADADAAPSDRSSDAAVEVWCFLLGLSNGAGGFGKKLAQPATGGVASVTGVNGTTYANGLLALGPDRKTKFSLSVGVTVPGIPPGKGSVAGTFVAETPGVVGNLQAGSKLTWISPPANSDPSCVLSQALAGGTDVESKSAALERIYERLQHPPKGGTAFDWRTWAEAVATVVRSYGYPIRNGTGTVDEVVTIAGSGLGRAPDSTLLAAVEAAFDASRLVCVEGRRALAPYMPAEHALTVQVRAVPAAPQYDWDWDDTVGGPWAVAAYSSSGPVTLQLSAAIAPDLVAKVYNGSKPRIQVVNSNGPVVVEQVRCLGYDGRTQLLTLESALTGTPLIGDAVFAGGPIPAVVGTQIRDYVDSLGPSRTSGFADALDAWDDTVRTERISQIVIDSLDTDGSRVIEDIVKVAGVPQITIAVGTDPPTTDNWQAPDDSLNGPELPYLGRAFLTQ